MRIQEFLPWGGGGGGGPAGGPDQPVIKKLTFCFFVFQKSPFLSLFYRSQMVNFKENYRFQGSRRVIHRFS